MLTLGSGVDGFTLDPDNYRFLHTHEDIRIPARGNIYSINEANFHEFTEPVKRYLDSMKSGVNGKRTNARYVGALGLSLDTLFHVNISHFCLSIFSC